MPEHEREKFSLLALDDDFQRLIDKTNHLLAGWRKEYEAPMVSVSGGKDSMVMLHLVLQHWPGKQVVVWHWDWGDQLMPDDYQHEILTQIKSVIGSSGAELVVRAASPREVDQWAKKMFGNIKYLAREKQRDCSFIGLRASESGSREKRTQGFTSLDGVTGLPALYPMREWRAVDVWAYIVSRGVPHHSSYDLFATMGGTGYEDERLRLSVFYFDLAGDWMEVGMPQGVLLWRKKAEMS